MKRFFLVLFALFIFSLCFAKQPALAISPGFFETADCASEFDLYVSSDDVLCGYLTVPSDHDNPDGKEIRLGVVVLKAENAQPDPVFLAQGGPGGSTIDTYANYFYGPKADLRAGRDFVLLEQRGTLYSEPVLYCQEYDDLTMEYLDQKLSREESSQIYLEATRQCSQRLQEDGIVFSDFNSYQNARDIEALRLALGYEQINLYGVSYGSLLAQHYMRLFPDSLRSVILDGVVAPQNNVVLDSPRHEDRAFRHLFDSCVADDVCSHDYPDLENIFYDLIEELNLNPVHITLYDSETGQNYRALLDGDTLYSAIFYSLYVADFVGAIPKLIYAIKDGDYDSFSTILSVFVFDRTMSYGMYYTVMCAEDADFVADDLDLSGIHPYIADFNSTAAVDFLEVCQVWDVEPLGSGADKNVESDVPVLLLSGGFDPVTPASNAQLAAISLANSYQVELPRGAHGQMLDDGCGDSIIDAFWKNPHQAPDTTCVADDDSPLFIGHGEFLPSLFLKRVLELDSWLLAEAALFGLAWLGLFSSVFLLPLVWLIQRFTRQADDMQSSQPACLLRFAGPVAWFNSLTMLLFAGLFGKTFYDMLYDNLIVFGFHASARPIFLLPWLALLLTLAMFTILIAGWGSSAWSIWRKLYYTLVFLSACLCVGLLVYWRFFILLFA